MTALDLDDDELWTLMWSLLDSYVERVRLRDRCRRFASEPQAGPIEPDRPAQWADDDDRRLAGLDGIVAKFPERMRAVWDWTLAERLAEAVAGRQSFAKPGNIRVPVSSRFSIRNESNPFVRSRSFP